MSPCSIPSLDFLHIKRPRFWGVHTGIYEKTCVTASSEAKRGQPCSSVIAWFGWFLFKFLHLVEKPSIGFCFAAGIFLDPKYKRHNANPCHNRADKSCCFAILLYVVSICDAQHLFRQYIIQHLGHFCSGGCTCRI